MARPPCLYCGQPAGSREHVFPAAMGGRRVDKGLLCGPCNMGMSDLDWALGEGFLTINGLLGVRGDRRVEARRASMQLVATGEAFQVDGRGRSEAEPIELERRLTEEGEYFEMRFASKEQAQQWAHKLRKQGKAVRFTGDSDEHTRFLVGRGKVVMEIGGRQMLRALGKIALNVLAQRFPDLARHKGLSEFRTFVRHGGTEEHGGSGFACIVEPQSPGVAAQPFSFGHRVLVGVDGDGVVFGRVCLFEEIECALLFGQVVAPEGAYLLDVDPLAEAPPDDQRATEFEKAVGAVRNDQLENSFPDMERRLGRLLARVFDIHWDHFASGLVANLRALPGPVVRLRDVEAAMAPCEQRLVNLINMVVEDIAASTMHLDRRLALRAMVEHDIAHPSRLPPATRVMLGALRQQVALLVVDAARRGHLSSSWLRSLLEGEVGLQVAGRTVAAAIAPRRVRRIR